MVVRWMACGKYMNGPNTGPMNLMITCADVFIVRGWMDTELDE